MRKELEPSNCIKAVPIFKNLTSDELDQIIMISSHQKLDKRGFIYTAGDALHSLFVIHAGKIKVTRYSDDGKEQVIRILSRGDFLGELALFSNAKVTTYAEAIEPTIVCLVDGQHLKQLMLKSPAISMKMMNELSNRLEKAEAMIELSNLYPAVAKVAKLLLDLAKNNYVYFNTTKVNLASNIGISPETFSRKLKELEDQKFIKIFNNKELKILDADGLELLINPEKL